MEEVARTGSTAGIFEREAHVETIEGLLEATAAGRGRLLVFEGPPGTGKSRLLEEAANRADRRGFQVLAAGASELEQVYAFGVALQLLEAAVVDARGDDRRDLFTGPGAPAAPLFLHPADAVATSTTTSQANDDHGFAYVHGLSWLVRILARRRPLLLLVDDAHWADRASLRLLHHLATRIGRQRIAVIVSTRPLIPEHRAGVERRWLGSQPALVLPPLSQQGIAALTRTECCPDADDEFCQAIHRATGGNPFLAKEVLTAARLEGLPPSHETAARITEFVPDSVRRSVQTRLAALPPEAAQLLQASAILGEDSKLPHAAAVAGLQLDEAAALLGILNAAGLAGRDGCVTVRNQVIRSAIAADLSEADYDRLHRQAAVELLRRGDAVEKAARHLLVTGPRADGWVVSALWAAGHRARCRGAPSSAVEYLRRALAEPPPTDVQADLLIDLGLAEASLGDRTALDRLSHAATLTRDRARRADAWYGVGSLLRATGDLAAAAEAFDHGLAFNPAPAAPVTGRLVAALSATAAVVPGLGERYRSRLEAANRQALSTIDATVLALSEEAFARAVEGVDHVSIRRLAVQALAGGHLLAREGPDGPALQRTLATLVWCDGFDEAASVIDEALAVAEEQHSVMALATMHYRRGALRLRLGDIASAISDARQAIAAADAGWAVYLPAAQAVLAHALLEHDDVDGALAALGSWDRADTATPAHAVWREARGCTLLAAGRAAEALSEFLATGEVLEGQLGWRNPAFRPWRSWAALAHLRAGARNEATELADEELALTRRFGAPSSVGRALRVAGVVRGKEGIALLSEAAGLLATSPALLERAETELALGEMLLRSGRREDALRRLKSAVTLGRRCGAPVVTRSAHSLVRVAGGHSPRSKAVAGSEALTPAERRVVQLARDGLTNKEIASQLYVTVKAIEFHLHNSYLKLGISSRRELRSGTVPTDEF